MNDPYLVIYQTLDFRADLKSKMALAMVQSIYLSPMGVACKQIIPADSFMDWRNVMHGRSFVVSDFGVDLDL